MGRTSERSLPEPKEARTLGLETIPLAQREIEYPAMIEMHDASSLASGEEERRIPSGWSANRKLSINRLLGSAEHVVQGA